VTCDPDALDPLIVVSLTRGDDPALVIGPDCPDDGVGVWWTSIVLPQWAYRYTQAPPSAWVPGNVLMAAVVDSTTLALALTCQGTDQASLEAQKQALTDTLGQWPYYAGVTIGTTPLGTYRADPTIPLWSVPLAQQDVGLFIAEGTVSIPLNPVGAP
jgi:hypothetical protein